MSYFTTLLRYIHQNPVKAGIVEHVREYEFSSWGEYDGSVDSVSQICDTAAVLRGKPYEQLNDFPHGTECKEGPFVPHEEEGVMMVQG